MTLLKVESFQQFYFPFFTEENTQLELLHTIHKGKEANHPNFRDSTFQTLKSCHCYAEWTASIYIQIYKWNILNFFVLLVILSTAYS